MLRPIGDHILVEPLSKEEVTQSGIVLPEAAQKKSQQGTVLAVGAGKWIEGKLVSFKELGLEPGMVVMFTDYGPTKVELEKKEYFILDYNDILGIVENHK